MTGTSLLTSWTLDPLQIAPIVLIAVAYAMRVRTLAHRGQPVAGWRIALFSLGLALLLAAVVSPVNAVGEEELVSFHMLQHILIGDLAPLCLLAGLTGQILQPLLAVLPVNKLRVLANPLIALPFWALNLYVWHIPFLYEAAVEYSLVHTIEHVSFFAAGIVMWMPVLETLPAPEWFGTGAKLAYIVAVRMVETLLANIFLWSGDPFYSVYAQEGTFLGLSATADQALAGGILLLSGSLVTATAIAWLFLRMAQESEVRQQLLERGLDPRTVRRAVRYGRWRELV